ncbi:hypothetical protein [Pseudomonas sp. R45(2017)]|uniref:hypothetical protein n=1 Tax=Pseudomonas sp. R45(2017) TaxID=1981678 RepID=UPI000A1F1E5C|nr:hypothetical protein [Pseudomonas sp. R45(2017)]
MIIEKLFDSVYEQASRYFTKWRGGSFALAWAVVSGAVLKFFELDFWSGGAGDAGAGFIASLSGLPFYQFFFFVLLAFYIAPLIANKTALFVVGREIKRTERLMVKIDAKVDGVSERELVSCLDLARKNAVEAEGGLQFKKAINEVYTFFLLVLLMLVVVGDINLGFLLFFGLPWFFFVYFLVQEMLLLYFDKIYLFKKLSARMAANLHRSL